MTESGTMMRFVELKSEEQLDMQPLHRVRDQLVGERTSLMNQIRSLLTWLRGFLARAHCNIAVIALAAKMARIVSALLRHECTYDTAATPDWCTYKSVSANQCRFTPLCSFNCLVVQDFGKYLEEGGDEILTARHEPRPGGREAAPPPAVILYCAY